MGSRRINLATRVKYVAFFRNLNLGRPNCPTKAQFEAAFVAAGASSASSFLTNGTLVYTVGPGHRSKKVFADACEVLRGSCGLKEPGYVRTVKRLADLVALNPFSDVQPGSVYACCVSFLHPDSAPLAELPLESRRGDVKVLRCTGSEALSISLKLGNTPGSPNAFLEKQLGLPATTRVWNTVVRLVERHV